ncbi:MAG: hypothetical protein HKN33_19180 [Pyrinomonadaceae bacterium]|nr:hypothetical protein [Pyrinomonadaceae bacterium]
MKYPELLTRLVATATLIFVNCIFLYAQTELPAGTIIPVQMENGINSESAGVDDTFTAVTTKPFFIDGSPVLSAGASFTGRITNVEAASGASKPGSLKVEIVSLRFRSGVERKVSGKLVNELTRKRSSIFSAIAVLGGAAAGGIFGMLSKTRNGGAIGAGIGAGAGTGVALARKGKDVGIETDEVFEIELTKTVQLPAEGY